jgi:energy-coupling factor transporter ATP-binding protein EcfA2
MKKNKTPRPNPSEVGTETPAGAPAVIMNQTDHPKIRLENITYYYGKGTPFEVKALDGVSVNIESNRITGIIGHTGSGKSTLVQMFNGLIRPTSGKILLDGEDIWADPKKISAIRYRVGLVMQYPEYQLFEETVEADIAYGPKNMGLDADEIAKRVAESAKFVGLEEESLKKSPFDLSGGQKRRAAIAGIMAMRPEVLVLDEPSAGLDPAGKKSIFDGIKSYAEATEEYSEIYENYKSRMHFISLSVSHEDLSELEEAFSELIGAAKSEDETAITIAKSRLTDRLGHIKRLCGINIDSIF